MQKTDEIEYWSIWLGDDTDDYTVQHKETILLDRLNYDFLDKFLEDNDEDVMCLTIVHEYS